MSDSDDSRQSPALRNHLLDHAEETPAPYVIKNTDPYLVDATVEKINFMLDGKGLRAVDRKEGIQSMSAILGLGDEGEKFHELDEKSQHEIMIAALNAQTLPLLNEAVHVGLELKPAQPAVTGPSGPAFAPMGPGGMGGGMRPAMPQPIPPGGMPPSYMPPQAPMPGFDPYTGQPLYPHAYPPQAHPQGAPNYPPTAYPAYPPQPYPSYPYPPQGTPPFDERQPVGAGQHGGQQGYAQPHPYPSYPVPPQPYYGTPPHGMPPQTPPAPWPPQQPGQPAQPAGYPYPLQQNNWPPPPIVVDADVDESASGDETK